MVLFSFWNMDILSFMEKVIASFFQFEKESLS